MENIKQKYELVYKEPLTSEVISDAIEKYNKVKDLGANTIKTMMIAEPEVDPLSHNFSASSKELFDISAEEVKKILTSNKLLMLMFIRPNTDLLILFSLGCSLVGAEQMFTDMIGQ